MTSFYADEQFPLVTSNRLRELGHFLGRRGAFIVLECPSMTFNDRHESTTPDSCYCGPAAHSSPRFASPSRGWFLPGNLAIASLHSPVCSASRIRWGQSCWYCYPFFAPHRSQLPLAPRQIRRAVVSPGGRPLGTEHCRIDCRRSPGPAPRNQQLFSCRGTAPLVAKSYAGGRGCGLCSRGLCCSARF